MKNKFLYIFTLILILSACKKEGNSYVKGTVRETGSNAPMEGVEVTLYKSSSKGSLVVESVKTNSEGKYILSYNKMPGDEYSVKCAFKGYVLKEYMIGKDIEKRKEAVNFVMFPVAFIKLRYIKTTASSNSIFGKFSNGDVNDGWFFFPGVIMSMATQPYDTIRPEIHGVYGNAFLNIGWSDVDLNAGGVPIVLTKSDRVFIPKGDTLVYTFTFN